MLPTIYPDVHDIVVYHISELSREIQEASWCLWHGGHGGKAHGEKSLVNLGLGWSKLGGTEEGGEYVESPNVLNAQERVLQYE